MDKMFDTSGAVVAEEVNKLENKTVVESKKSNQKSK